MDLERLRGKCGVCLQALSGALLSSCPSCGTSYHPECWEFNRRKCAVYGCWKSPFPKRRLGPPQRHVDIFNPFVMASMVVAVVALFAWNLLRWFQS